MLPSAHWIKANGYTLDLHYGRVTLIDLPANLTVSSSHVDELLGSFLNYGDSLYSNTLQIIADPSLSIWHCSRAIIPHNFMVSYLLENENQQYKEQLFQDQSSTGEKKIHNPRPPKKKFSDDPKFQIFWQLASAFMCVCVY